MISSIVHYFRIGLAFAVAASAPMLAFAETAEQLFVQQKFLPQPGQCLDVAVDLANSPGFSQAQVADVTELRYRMGFNNVAEGWSWHEGAASLDEDYYRFKFLPLQSVLEERGEYRSEDKIGVEQTMRRTWRYDYFLAFENLYDFYPRKIDDEAGFVASLGKAWLGQVGMQAHACLVEPIVSESTTFWKATYAKPTDFTLKKRYLIALLKSVTFFDPQTGQVLAVVKP